MDIPSALTRAIIDWIGIETKDIAAATITARTIWPTFTHPFVLDAAQARRAVTPRISTLKSRASIRVMAHARVSPGNWVKRCPPVRRSIPARIPETARAGPLTTMIPSSRAAAPRFNEYLLILPFPDSDVSMPMILRLIDQSRLTIDG